MRVVVVLRAEVIWEGLSSLRLVAVQEGRVLLQLGGG
jgi:hypothetical protein